MTTSEFLRVLQSSGIPFSYRVWRKPPPLPWGVFEADEPTVFWADGEPYYTQNRYRVELYADRKSPTDEAALELALMAAGVSFTRSDEYIESERLFETIYDCEV